MSFDFSGSAYDLDLDYDYNPASQLTRQGFSHNRYHHEGGRGLLGDYEVNGLNQYTSAGGQSVAHDANDNLTDIGSTDDYQYDAENRLIDVEGAQDATLSYNPKGRLHQIPVNGNTTTFVYDGDSLVAEYHNGTRESPLWPQHPHGHSAGGLPRKRRQRCQHLRRLRQPRR